MKLKKARQILKTLAEDNRLRIMGLLKREGLNVSDMSQALGINQSNLSKHLYRLRLNGLVYDVRRGANVYYYLKEPEDRSERDLLHSVTAALSEMDYLKADWERLKRTKKAKKTNKVNLEFPFPKNRALRKA